MPESKRRARKARIQQAACVACGCCVKVCPRGAISVVKGIFAAVDDAACVGCGLCARECPASVITVSEVSQ